MDSLNLLKQELINQKTLLDQKGFPVITANTNPSPSEITSAIENININFQLANASTEDVSLGKTFYAQTGELKTGTLDVAELRMLSEIASAVLTGKGSVEIYIPTDSNCTLIKDYAYSNMVDDNSTISVELYNSNLFYKHNLTIPSNIIRVGNRAFSDAQVTGLLTVPETCTEVGVAAFQRTHITEAIVHNGITSNNASAYMFAECPNLVKVTFHDLITFLPSYTFQYCEALKEVYLPSTLTEIKSSCFYKTPNVELIKFTSTTPPILSSATTLKYACNAVLLAPYQYYNDYYTATNYLTHGNPIMGYGEFNLGDSLPSSITGYSTVWYPTLADAKNSTNATTTCTATGTMYAVLSAV